MFEDGGGSDSESAQLNSLETEVCRQLQTVFTFRQGALGQSAIDNPTLLADAIHTMIQGAGGSITECSSALDGSATTIPPLSPTGIPVTDDMFMTNPAGMQDRVDRALRTLTRVIEPEAATTFATLNTCGSAPVSVAAIIPATQQQQQQSTDPQTTLKSSISGALQMAAGIRNRYLIPIQQKQDDLHAGRLSDCDKQKGAATAMHSS